MATKHRSAKNQTPPEKLLAQAIDASGVAEVIKSSQGAGTVKLLYRVSEKRTWLAVLEYALSRADGWSAHACQQYFMRGGKLVFGWNFILQTEGDLLEAAKKAGALIAQGAKVAPKVMGSGQLSSFPLVGHQRNKPGIVFDPRLPGPSRGGPSHKGAYSIKTE